MNTVRPERRSSIPITPESGHIAPLGEIQESMLLVSAGYNGRDMKAFLVLYDVQSGNMRTLGDETGHLPYCLSDLSPEELEGKKGILEHPGFDHLEIVEKEDLLRD